MDLSIFWTNIFLVALLVAAAGIVFRLIFQKNNPPAKWFVLDISLAAIFGSELLAITFYFGGLQLVQWWMVPLMLVASLVFPKLPDAIQYIIAGKPLTFAALWQHFLEKTKEEFNPILKDILQFLIDNWNHFDLPTLQSYLKQLEMTYIQQQLTVFNKRLQDLQTPVLTTPVVKPALPAPVKT